MRTRERSPLDGDPIAPIFMIMFVFMIIGFLAWMFKRNYMALVLAVFLLGDLCLLYFFLTVGFKDARRYLVFIMGLVAFAVLFPLAPDVPYALRQQYLVAEGVPTETLPELDKHGAQIGSVVYFNNLSFTFEGTYPGEIADNWIIVHYLPNTQFYVDYQILSYADTIKKEQQPK